MDGRGNWILEIDISDEKDIQILNKDLEEKMFVEIKDFVYCFIFYIRELVKDALLFTRKNLFLNFNHFKNCTIVYIFVLFIFLSQDLIYYMSIDQSSFT